MRCFSKAQSGLQRKAVAMGLVPVSGAFLLGNCAEAVMVDQHTVPSDNSEGLGRNEEDSDRSFLVDDNLKDIESTVGKPEKKNKHASLTEWKERLKKWPLLALKFIGKVVLWVFYIILCICFGAMVIVGAIAPACAGTPYPGGFSSSLKL